LRRPLDHRTSGHSIGSGKRQAAKLLPFIVALLATVGAVTGAATADPSISSKQAQARAVLAQIQEIQGSVERASNALYSANAQLHAIEGDLHVNTNRLAVARQGLGVAQARVEARLRALYMHGSSGGTVEILLGAQNLDDLLNRIDAAKRVSRQDTKVLREVRGFRAEVEHRQVNLKQARASQATLVQQREREKRAIEGQLAEQNRLYSSIKDEIVKLKAAEVRRQALLASQARARYLAQIQAARQQALEPPAESQDALDPASQPFSSEAPPPPPSYGNVVGIALQYLGTPYVWGASGPGAFDCSGFTAYVYAQVGISLPHNAAAQFGYGTPVSRDELQPGDLVFFDGLGHVGLYIGGGNFVHAPHTGDVVKISSLYDPWYSATWVGARRL
jgi:cell wall-associated NlpC family hydrolase